MVEYIKINYPIYFKEIAEERRLRIDGRLKPDPNANVLWKMAIESVKEEEAQNLIIRAFEYANKIKYRHVGLTSDIYFAHPVRTAAMSMLCEECENIDFGIVGLLHNVFELSDTSTKIIAKHFGESIANQISDLTVDRELQWDYAYKQDYYNRINSNALSCRVVKVFDKIDNMFLLGLNPDDIIRGKYLDEIESYILPMAERDIPSVFPYLKLLFKDCKDSGFFG